LLTGNLEAGARIKLGYFDLFDDFPFGAFGSDDESRNKLPPLALERAEKVLGKNFAPSEVLIIGDSTADVECGLTNGMKILAVGTGRTTGEELYKAGAHAVVNDLNDTVEIMNMIMEL
jgi:phosphoglycolate phosphatase-like HAD superfamily hydrolase